MGVGLADRTGKCHRRMTQQRFFDLGRVDIVTAADDHILGPPGDPQIAVIIQTSQIAGAQVFAVIIQVFVLGRLGIGALRAHAWIRDADLTDLSSGHLDRTVGTLPHDLDVGIREGQPDRADLLFTVNRVRRDDTGRFGQAIAFDDGQATGLLEPAEQLHRHRGRAGKRFLDCRNIRIHRALHQGRNSGRHGGDERGLVAFVQLPEILHHTLTAIARRRREDDMRAGKQRRVQHHMARHHMKQRQRAHHRIIGVNQQAANPTVIDEPAIGMLGHLGHPGGAAGVEIERNAVFAAIVEFQRLGLARDFRVEVQIFRMGRRFRRHLGPQERHQPAFGRAEIAVQVNFENGHHMRRVAHRFGDLLGHVALGEGFERHHHFGICFPKDSANLLGFEQRVDRVHDTRHRAAQHAQDRFVTDRQDIGYNVGFTDPQIPQHVGGLVGFLMHLAPGQRLGLVGRPRCQLKGDALVPTVAGRRAGQHFAGGARHVARFPGLSSLNGVAVRSCCDL